MLTLEERAEIEAEMLKYPARQSACIDAMKIVQRRRGWVSDESISDIAELLSMSPADLDGVASFYNLIFRKPVARHVIYLCDSVSCWLMGYERLRDRIEALLDIKPGGATADNRFTLLPIVCLGCCDRAPAMMVDEDLHTNLDAAGVEAALERYK